MSLGLIGKKIGMTREFFSSGLSVPVTVIKIEKGRVIDIYNKEKNGYSAVKLGFMGIKNSKLTKQMKGFYAKKNTEPKKILKEYRVEKVDEYKIGNEIGLELFKDVKFLELESFSDKRTICFSTSTFLTFTPFGINLLLIPPISPSFNSKILPLKEINA